MNKILSSNVTHMQRSFYTDLGEFLSFSETILPVIDIMAMILYWFQLGNMFILFFCGFIINEIIVLCSDKYISLYINIIYSISKLILVIITLFIYNEVYLLLVLYAIFTIIMDAISTVYLICV